MLFISGLLCQYPKVSSCVEVIQFQRWVHCLIDAKLSYSLYDRSGSTFICAVTMACAQKSTQIAPDGKFHVNKGLQQNGFTCNEYTIFTE